MHPERWTEDPHELDPTQEIGDEDEDEDEDDGEPPNDDWIHGRYMMQASPNARDTYSTFSGR